MPTDNTKVIVQFQTVKKWILKGVFFNTKYKFLNQDRLYNVSSSFWTFTKYHKEVCLFLCIVLRKKWDLIGWLTKLSYSSTMLSQIPKLSWWWHNSLTIIIQQFFGVYGRYRQTLSCNKEIMPDDSIRYWYGRFLVFENLDFYLFFFILSNYTWAFLLLHLKNSKAFL